MSDDEGLTTFTIVAAESDSDTRLDSFISSHIAYCSRGLAASLIKKGFIRVSGSTRKPGSRIRTGDIIEGTIPEPEPVTFQPEAIQLCVLYEDAHIIIVNKVAGMVVHPAPGHATGTLVNALLHHCPDLEGIGGERRPGIVHRLDKDTSGVLVVAKNQTSHQKLSAQFKTRRVNKEYLAVVHGDVKQEKGTIQKPLGRHPSDRKKMSVHSRKPRTATTIWQVKERFDGFTLLLLQILTGRTHQIRVHMSSENHPIVGDPVYGTRTANRKIRQARDKAALIHKVTRQMLHAYRIQLQHPHTEEMMEFEAPVPEDMQVLVDGLRASRNDIRKNGSL